jgi:hypothetical protein
MPLLISIVLAHHASPFIITASFLTFSALIWSWPSSPRSVAHCSSDCDSPTPLSTVHPIHALPTPLSLLDNLGLALSHSQFSLSTLHFPLLLQCCRLPTSYIPYSAFLLLTPSHLCPIDSSSAQRTHENIYTTFSPHHGRLTGAYLPSTSDSPNGQDTDPIYRPQFSFIP